METEHVQATHENDMDCLCEGLLSLLNRHQTLLSAIARIDVQLFSNFGTVQNIFSEADVWHPFARSVWYFQKLKKTFLSEFSGRFWSDSASPVVRDVLRLDEQSSKVMFPPFALGNNFTISFWFRNATPTVKSHFSLFKAMKSMSHLDFDMEMDFAPDKVSLDIYGCNVILPTLLMSNWNMYTFVVEDDVCLFYFNSKFITEVHCFPNTFFDTFQSLFQAEVNVVKHYANFALFSTKLDETNVQELWKYGLRIN